MHQSIYAFSGAENALIVKKNDERFNNLKISYLSQSFRFNHNIAILANRLIRNFKFENNLLIGSNYKNINNNNIISNLSLDDFYKHCEKKFKKINLKYYRISFLSRTNNGIVFEIVKLIKLGLGNKYKFKFIGGYQT